MRITNEIMAQALGWKFVEGHKVKDKTHYCVFCDNRWKPPRPDMNETLPAYTTDLNAIVGAIEEKGLIWHVGKGTEAATASVTLPVSVSPNYYAEAKTAPLALSLALYAYLKESRP